MTPPHGTAGVPRGPLVALLVAVAGAAVIVLATAGQLPALVGFRFDLDGRPVAHVAREVYRAWMLGFGVLFPLCVAGLVAVAPRLPGARVGTDAMTPDQRTRAMRLLRGYGCGIGVIAAVCVSGVHALVLTAHAMDPPRLSNLALFELLAIVTAALAFWTLLLWVRLKLAGRPPSGPAGTA